MLNIREFYGMDNKEQIEQEVVRQYLRSTNGKEIDESNLIVIALTNVVCKTILGEKKN